METNLQIVLGASTTFVESASAENMLKLLTHLDFALFLAKKSRILIKELNTNEQGNFHKRNFFHAD